MVRRSYFISINCVLIILAAFLCVKTIYEFAGPRKYTEAPQKPQTRQPTLSDTIQHPLIFYDNIAKRNLFNPPDGRAKTEEPVNLESLEQTKLKLKLLGTATGDGKEGYAVIEDSTERSQNLYRRGDTLQSATIKTVLRGKVILIVNGRGEVLEMEKSTGGESAVYDSHAETDTPTPSISRSQIDKTLKNINSLLQQAIIIPHFNNGQPDGFSLIDIRPDTLIQKVGLRNGDIITGLNGRTIKTMDDAREFYRQLGSSESISLQIKRQGNDITIECDIK
ncbi:MAG: type II secretion system protein N [Syntrophales bacterium]|nr:type II secretion system protein N [Syntrophales bacterium]